MTRSWTEARTDLGRSRGIGARELLGKQSRHTPWRGSKLAAASDHRAGSEQQEAIESCGWLVVRYPEHLGLNELKGIVGSASAQLRLYSCS